jgi:DNA mismatch endonuclease (patch repair protein)
MKRSKKDRLPMKCLECGKIIYLTPYLSKIRKYCSSKCSDKNLIRRKKMGEKMSIVKTGTKMSEECKLKHSQYRGWKHTEESKEKCRQARLHQTFKKFSNIEKLIKEEILKRNLPFEHNKEVLCCIPDFSNKKYKIAIFCDGTYWHSDPEKYSIDKLSKIQIHNMSYDIKNNEALNKEGYKVLRFWEREINESPQKCVDSMERELLIRGYINE